MKTRYKILLGLSVLIIASISGATWYVNTMEEREPSLLAWHEHCASCHGEQMKGTDDAPPLLGTPLKHGDSTEQLISSIRTGFPGTTMTGWENKLSPEKIKGLALLVSEHRQAFPTTAASYDFKPDQTRTIKSTYHDFTLEKVTDLKSRPYSIVPLPDGRLIVAEKIRGLSVIENQGNQGDLIKGTPEVWDTLISVKGAWANWGIVLDVALHPDYESNGWIYLSHTDRCQLDCGWPIPATMVRVVRGRIAGNQWMDQEVIWSVHKDHYTPVPDGVAAGRLAFDQDRHLYISIGGKNTYDKLHDLNTPFGKIHRVKDDGSVPEDNPFWTSSDQRPETSTIHTVWSYGHRTGQGLDGHPETGAIWNTEMGPRGGDEINLISKGGNYGWPLYTNGLDYNGERVTIGEELGLDYPIEETVLPVLDWTPAPAVSNFTFHKGNAFPRWKDDLLVGSLKAATLYRVRIEDGMYIEQEKLITDFGRIRDVAMGPDGFIYIALEHGEAGSVWRMKPTP